MFTDTKLRIRNTPFEYENTLVFFIKLFIERWDIPSFWNQYILNGLCILKRHSSTVMSRTYGLNYIKVKVIKKITSPKCSLALSKPTKCIWYSERNSNLGIFHIDSFIGHGCSLFCSLWQNKKPKISHECTLASARTQIKMSALTIASREI